MKIDTIGKWSVPNMYSRHTNPTNIIGEISPGSCVRVFDAQVCFFYTKIITMG